MQYPVVRKLWSIKDVPKEEFNFVMDPDVKQDCLNILKKMAKMDNCQWFMVPVDTRLVANYLTVIKNPMDLGTVKDKLLNDEYKDTCDFADDVRQVWMNCERFNVPDDPFDRAGKGLAKAWERSWKQLIRKLNTLCKTEETRVKKEQQNIAQGALSITSRKRKPEEFDAPNPYQEPPMRKMKISSEEEVRRQEEMKAQQERERLKSQHSKSEAIVRPGVDTRPLTGGKRPKLVVAESPKQEGKEENQLNSASAVTHGGIGLEPPEQPLVLDTNLNSEMDMSTAAGMDSQFARPLSPPPGIDVHSTKSVGELFEVQPKSIQQNGGHHDVNTKQLQDQEGDRKMQDSRNGIFSEPDKAQDPPGTTGVVEVGRGGKGGVEVGRGGKGAVGIGSTSTESQQQSVVTDSLV